MMSLIINCPGKATHHMGCLFLSLAFALSLSGCQAPDSRSCHLPHPGQLELSATVPIDLDAIHAGRSPVVTVSAKYVVMFGEVRPASPTKGKD